MLHRNFNLLVYSPIELVRVIDVSDITEQIYSVGDWRTMRPWTPAAMYVTMELRSWKRDFRKKGFSARKLSYRMVTTIPTNPITSGTIVEALFQAY